MSMADSACHALPIFSNNFTIFSNNFSLKSFNSVFHLKPIFNTFRLLIFLDQYSKFQNKNIFKMLGSHVLPRTTVCFRMETDKSRSYLKIKYFLDELYLKEFK